MASGPQSSFDKALNRFQDSLTKEQRNQFSITSLKDVHSEIKRIQNRFGPEKKLRNANKLSKFLEAMDQLEKVITVFLNVNEVVAFVWGPIKFALVVASTRMDMLERLLDTYVEIGEVVPGLRQYDQLFKNFPDVRKVLEWYFLDILQFHRKSLDVFGRPAWETVMRSVWKTFETNFKPILDSLRRHRDLLSDRKLTAAIVEIQDFRKLAETKFDEQSAQSNATFEELSRRLQDRFQELSKQLYESRKISTEKEAREEREALQQQRSFIAEKLGHPNYEADQQSASEHRFSGTGDWMLENSTFLNWLDPKNLSYSTLYLHGMPGAGKTTLISRIIDHLKAKGTASNPPLLFFYFKHGEESKRCMAGMLRAILVQLIYQDEALIEYLYKKCCSATKSELGTLPVLKELAYESLETQRHCRIILDGLDECGSGKNMKYEELISIIDWFQNSLIPNSHSRGGCIRLLLSGQRDGVLEQHLSTLPSIKLDTVAAHLHDIHGYTESKASDIRERFSLDHESEVEITNKVTEASKGMFLYAKVVLDNLLEQGSEAELEDELKTENFPKGLDSAYERVVVRVLDRPNKQKKEAAARILGWLICAARPLWWREIQSRFCIDIEQGYCNFKKRRVDSCKILCGSLVEAEQCNWGGASGGEMLISLVHETAGKYLTTTKRISLLEEHTNMALFCAQYLTSRPFRKGIQEGHARDFALSGYYGFQDYAAAFWNHHVEFILNGTTGPSVTVSILQLITEYEVTQKAQSPHSDSQCDPTAEQIQKILQEWHNNGRRDSFVQRTSTIRRVIESIDHAELDDREKQISLELNGILRFKCPRPRCQKFAVGLIDRGARDSHVREHDRPFRCPTEECFARSTGYPSQSELDKHIKRWHSESGGPKLFPSREKSSDIFNACIKGDLDTVKAFVDQGVNVNVTTRNRGQITPLILATRNGHPLVCQYLIQKGAEVYPSIPTRPRGAITALEEAIKLRDYDLFRTLVETAGDQARLMFLNRPLNTYLWHFINVAVECKVAEILSDLLSWKVQVFDLNSEDIAQVYTTMRCAVDGGNESIVQILLATDQVDRVLKHKEGQTILHIATRNRHVEVVKMLLATGQVDPDSRDNIGQAPLHIAAQGGHEAVVQMLLATGQVDPNLKDASGQTPLLIATNNRHEEVVKILLATGQVDLDLRDIIGQTTLHNAQEWCITVVQMLLATGQVDPDSRDKDYQTILNHAVQGGYEAVMQILLATGQVDLDSRNNFGQTSLNIAVKRGYGAVVQMLLTTGKVDPGLRDMDGQTPLHHAAWRGHEAVMQMLLATGQVDPDSRNIFDQTPLNIAVQGGHKAVVQILLATGQVDPNSRDASDQTPLFIAASKGYEAVMQVLLATDQVDPVSATELDQTLLHNAA